MKKILLLILALSVSALLFISCGQGSAGPSGAAGPSGNSLQVVNLQDNGTYSGATDTFIDGGTGSTTENFSTFFWIFIGTDESGGGDYARGLEYFSLTSMIPSNAVIQRAYLTVYSEPSVANWEGGVTTITAYAIPTASYDAWTQTGATWVSSTATTMWTNLGGDYYQTPISNAVVVNATNLQSSYTFQLTTSVVQNWFVNPSQNNGMILKASNENVANNSFGYCTDTNSTVSLRPMLTLYYSLQ